MSSDFQGNVVQSMPYLRSFALYLARDRCTADDLVQEALLRALTHVHQFQPGTNFKAWITTILRNAYFNLLRDRKRMHQLQDLGACQVPAVSGGQEELAELRDLESAFERLPTSQREALMLVGAGGYSYEEAAEEVSCAVGTMKSRVSRARNQLLQWLDDGPPATASRTSIH
ncbi:MAG TPA: sigma-70 family RNA polymerase sigma factor [Stellaceae bacterium]|nr:sigma-70 family RNA polymerase sigma factor [Stellaceae bacterium]